MRQWCQKLKTFAYTYEYLTRGEIIQEPLSILVVLAYIMTKDVFLIQYLVDTPKFESETLLLYTFR